MTKSGGMTSRALRVFKMVSAIHEDRWASRGVFAQHSGKQRMFAVEKLTEKVWFSDLTLVAGVAFRLVCETLSDLTGF